MAEADTCRTAENPLARKPPKVPIPTYRWEDVRRSKLQGGYPWTHLYKAPFGEEPHPERYTMEEFRRSKSSSTLARPNTLDIQELPNGTPSERGSTEPIITEAVTPDVPPKIHVGGRDSVVSVQTLESAESSDNVSQYLEKEREETKEEPKVEQMQTEELVAGRTERAKSEEPKRKRKLSIESSYSRISLSKLAFLKKMRDAKEKVKIPKLSFRRHKNDPESQKKAEQEKLEKEKKKKEKRREEHERLHPDKPVYIHIPLKPPPGETDEFSYLEFEEKKPAPSTSKQDEQQPPASLDSAEVGVQFIVLTPPSDDEVLSDSTIPETPSESEKFFDNSKIDELKTLAKNAVDLAIASKKLETVREENGNGKEATPPPPQQKDEAMVVEQETKMEVDEAAVDEKMAVDDPVEQKVVIDEEDGLRSNEATASTPSQVEKKRLSFRRQYKKIDPERIYEDVQVQKTEDETAKTDDEKLKATDATQSMSVDEEKTYLDQKIIKNTSLEEDYNKWSKTNDHEYEPVCPPPDDTPQSDYVTETAEADLSKPAAAMEADAPLTAQELQTQIEERYFTVQEPPPPQPQEAEQTSKKAETGKFQQAIRDKAGKFKTRIQGIKRPHINMPSKPTFKIERPKISLPKMPDKTTIHMPSFGLARKRAQKGSLRERQFSTESNAGDVDAKKHHLFDFSTYPRFFHKKKKEDAETSSLKDEAHEPAPPVEFATVPRTNHKKTALASKWAQRFRENSEKQKKAKETKPKDRWGGKDTIRIPLHSEESMDKPVELEEHEASLERETATHTRFNEDIDAEDAYQKENQEIRRASPFSNDYNTRWDHGTFHQKETPVEYEAEYNNHQQVTDLDHEEPSTPRSGSYDVDTRDTQSSRGSLGSPRRGVLEEIGVDEFVLRQKGISQDDIDIRKYLNTEIREAFTSPRNVLYQVETDYVHDYDVTGSNQSLPERKEKKVPIKKPKRKKTPHVSAEHIPPEPEVDDYIPEEPLPPVPPARPVRKNRKQKKNKKNDVIPFQETIPLEPELPLRKTDSIMGRFEDDLKYYNENDYPEAYENECMKGIEQPEIHVTDPYAANILKYQAYQNTSETNDQFDKPEAPPRKPKSLKSLDYSEHDSLPEEEVQERNNIMNRLEDDIIPVSQEPPQKPTRTRSRTRSQSLATSQPDDEGPSWEDGQEPCVEEPCVQDIRDPMGYAIIDKSKVRDPPLPPPRTPPRRRRSIRSESGSSEKFATVPRSEQPVRPLRNYSTLGPSRPPRHKSSVSNLTDEEKENIDITQYIEIEEEPTRRLQSGEVIQKMKDRPLPAPPRPPRKSRALQDFNQDENPPSASPIEEDAEDFKESEVSTQTEPLPDDVVCEEVVPESSDQPVTRIINFQTPTHYTHEETVTHGTLIVQPLDGAKVIPDSQFSKIEKPKERIIPVTTDEEEETTEIPEDFHKLRDPQPKQKEPTKPQRLQIEDLDVNRLTVNELLANKISVSQIDGVTIQVNEITTRDGAPLKVNEIELPSNVVQKLLERIQAAAPSSILVEPEPSSILVEHESSLAAEADDVSSPVIPSADDDEQKKTPTEPGEEVIDPPPQRPPRHSRSEEEVDEARPSRPPRQATSQQTEDLSEEERQLVSELAAENVNDEPPPRPPHPTYFPSQPPASFYALRAQKLEQQVDIPTPPRRRRHRPARAPSGSASSSEESLPAAAAATRRRRRQTPEPSIPQLSCQLARACSAAAEHRIKRLIEYIATHVLENADGQQDLHVMIIFLMVLVAWLILMGFGEGRTTVHHHHWEYFNPPKEL